MKSSEIQSLEIRKCISESLNGEVYEAIFEGRSVIYRKPPTGSLELDIYQKFSGHPAIPDFLGTFQSGLVLEQLGDNLETAVSSKHLRFKPEDFREVSDFLDIIHKDGYIHRDIQPGNIVINNTALGIIDFGLVRKFSKSWVSDSSHTVIRYASSNQLKSLHEAPSDDLYSYALVCSYAFTGIRPWSDLGGAAIIMEVSRKHFPEDYGRKFRTWLSHIFSDRKLKASEVPQIVYDLVSNQ